MAREAIQAQLEATEARIYTMDQRLTERLDRVTQTLETVGNRLEGISASLDTWTVQVVQLNELKGLTRQLLQALDRQHELDQQPDSGNQRTSSGDSTTFSQSFRAIKTRRTPSKYS